uniref:Neurotransmitter-gated ion-channel ligand-binding domain-containing protein n=1 Tax=Lotharella globosa TaxID=91324 RepID=A0A7S4DWS6_9EUKA|mmetsp:Transcript_2368/g.4541  ORF Transcript_2368/g.4541 Transcript_2368/m.4541 type:complete len:535 (-) Transcript_2368:170-1774(-)
MEAAAAAIFVPDSQNRRNGTETKAKPKKSGGQSSAPEAKSRSSTTNSWIGSEYKAFHREHGRNPYDAKLLPKVEVAVKVYNIRNVDMTAGVFDMDFNLMMDWLDPSLRGRTAATAGDIDWDQHFVPSVFVENALQIEEVGGKSHPRLRGQPNRVMHTQRMRATLRNKYHVRNFPLDTQYLTVKFKARTVSDGNKWENGLTKSKATVWLTDPYTWRGKTGHQIAENADELPDLKLIKIDGGPVATDKSNLNETNEYHVQICVMRESAGTVYGLGVPLFGVMVLSFGVFVVELDDLGDRLALVITNMLTIVAIKWVLEAKLPSVPYLTLADQYVLACFVLLLVQGGICTLVAWLHESEHVHEAYLLNLWATLILFLLFVMTHAYLGFKAMGLRDEVALRNHVGLVDIEEEALENDDMTSPYLRGPEAHQLLDDSDILPTTEGLPYGWTGPYQFEEKDRKSGKMKKVNYYVNNHTGLTQRRRPVDNPGLRKKKMKLQVSIASPGAPSSPASFPDLKQSSALQELALLGDEHCRSNSN